MLGQRVPFRLEIRVRDVADMVDDAFFLNDPQILQRHGGGHRMAGIGIAVIQLAPLGHDLEHLVVDDRPANRLIARGQALGDGHDMGANAEGGRAEHIAGAAKAGDDLVGNQQDAVFVADALDFRPIGRGRNDHPTRALNRLTDKGCNLVEADLVDRGFQLPGALKPELLGRHVPALGPPVRLVDVVNPVDLAAMGVDRRHAPKTAAPHGRAVIAVLTRDDNTLFGHTLDLPIAPHKADIGVIGFRTGPGKEGVVHPLRRDLGQLSRQRDGRHMGGLEEGVVIAQLIHLALGHIAKFRAAIADVDAPQPGHAVDDLVAFAVLQPDALGRFDDPRALGRKAVGIGEGVHVVRRVQLLQLGRRHVVGDHVHGMSLRSRALNPLGILGRFGARYDQTRGLFKKFDQIMRRLPKSELGQAN